MESKTLVVELRLQDDKYADVLRTLDDLNDFFVSLAFHLGMDILSISHLNHFYPNAASQFSSTCVFLLNGCSGEIIVRHIKDHKGSYTYPFEDQGKVSVVLERSRAI